ncbi:recombinase family protein [Enterococcus pallens]|uniref:Resolvase n=1 Tax=Enterococcus pallens ATCC BAA-351 TaxID=1158607 RepID=R2S0F0_9ENTE|nr:recombinase family protein [Enterococcus pallens]EOH86296.1 resolvase [Enterococcus pallens ATCC BAA-351]EOU09483.1 resolvase [Enterococcus pallens ATCC BAA-351]
MARIGYARVSSKDQNLDRQLEALSHCSKIFKDKLSGKDTNRQGLQDMMEFIREGDIVVITELKRLGRNNKELTEVMNTIQTKGATIEVLNLPTLNGIANENLRRLLNNMIIELYKYQAQEEREYILQTQAQGIKIAKANGKYKGRKRLYSENDERLQHAFDLYRSGKNDSDVSRMTGINRETFRRYRKKYGITRPSPSSSKQESSSI